MKYANRNQLSIGRPRTIFERIRQRVDPRDITLSLMSLARLLLGSWSITKDFSAAAHDRSGLDINAEPFQFGLIAHFAQLGNRCEIVLLSFVTRYFVPETFQRMGRNIGTILTSALEHSDVYNWPMNTRELQNVLEWAIILTHGTSLHVGTSDFAVKADSLYIRPFGGRTDLVARADHKGALEEANGHGWRSERRGSSSGLKTNNTAEPHAEVRDRTPVSLAPQSVGSRI